MKRIYNTKKKISTRKLDTPHKNKKEECLKYSGLKQNLSARWPNLIKHKEGKDFGEFDYGGSDRISPELYLASFIDAVSCVLGGKKVQHFPSLSAVCWSQGLVVCFQRDEKHFIVLSDK